MFNKYNIIIPCNLCLIYAIYCIIYISRVYLRPITMKAITSKLWYGTQSKFCNPFILAISMSYLFTLCPINEILIGTGLTLTNIYLSRIFSLLVLCFLWNKLYKNGYTSLYEYIRQRYQSKMLNYIYYINVLIGVTYLWSAQTNIYQVYKLFFIKSNVKLFQFIILWILLTSLCGMPGILFNCLIMFVLEKTGQIVYIKKTFYIGKHFKHYTKLINFHIDDCWSLIGPNYFLINVIQLLSIQPGYNLFRSANSLKQANVTVLIAFCIVTLNTFSLAVNANTALNSNCYNNNTMETCIHSFYNLKLNTIGEFVHLNKTRSDKFNKYNSSVQPSHLLILLGFYFSNALSAFLLQIHSISKNTMEIVMSTQIITKAKTVHLTYSCMFVTFGFLIICYLLHIPSINNIHHHHLVIDHYTYEPSNTSILFVPVFGYILYGLLFHKIPNRSVKMSTVITIIFSILYVNEVIIHLEETSCMIPWYPTIVFVFHALLTILISFLHKFSFNKTKIVI